MCRQTISSGFYLAVTANNSGFAAIVAKYFDT